MLLALSTVDLRLLICGGAVLLSCGLCVPLRALLLSLGLCASPAQVSKLSRENTHLQLQVHSLQRRREWEQAGAITDPGSASDASSRASNSASESSDAFSATPPVANGQPLPTSQVSLLSLFLG